MPHLPRHTAILLHPHATVPAFADHAFDFPLWGPYADFQTTRDLRHVAWPVDLAYGRKTPVRRFILDGAVAPWDFASDAGSSRFSATLFEDGSCAVQEAGTAPTLRFALGDLLRVRPVDATDAPKSPMADPFGRANLEQAVGILAHPKLEDRPGERVVPDAWALFRDADGTETVAHVRRGDAVERVLEASLRQMREAENRILNLEHGKDRNAARDAVDAARAHIGALIHDEDGPKHRLQRLDGLNVYVGDKRWHHHFDTIDAMQFSSDGKRLAVVGERSGWRLAIDDRPGPGFDRIVGFRWLGPGACGYIGFREGRIWRVTVEI